MTPAWRVPEKATTGGVLTFLAVGCLSASS
jgi:hypothetical protein